MACKTRSRPLASPGRARRSGRAAAWAAVVAVIALAADVATKAWALSRLSGGRDIGAAGGRIRLQLVINHGASFGLGAAVEPLLSVVAVAGVILFAIWAVRAASRAERFGAALAAAGAAGNLADRLFRPPSVLHGGVVDWLHLWFYGPTFNLADVWLRAGVVIAAAAWLWRRRPTALYRPRCLANSTFAPFSALVTVCQRDVTSGVSVACGPRGTPEQAGAACQPSAACSRCASSGRCGWRWCCRPPVTGWP